MAVVATDERELKLDVPDGFSLPELTGEPLASRVFVSTYYDTADHRLARAGITLRRREENGLSAWQLKLPRGASRLEVEHEGGPARPPGPLQDALFGVARGEKLESVARLRTRREGMLVADQEQPLAEVVLDVVAVLDGSHVVEEFRELEVEARDGDGKALGRIEKDLRRAGATPGNGNPKVFRVLGETASSVKPKPDASAAEHLLAMIGAQLKAILAYDPAVRLGGTTDDVHQLRVATRRLRSVLRSARPLLEPAWSDSLLEELKWVGEALGTVRDLDVLIEHLEREAGSLPEGEQKALAGIVGQLAAARGERRAALVDQLSTPRYLAVLDALEDPRLADAETTVSNIAAAEFERARKAARRTETDEELHKLRVRVKRARYAAELAERAVGKPAADFVDAAKAFQDVVGEHQDAVVAEERLRELADQTGRSRAQFVLGRLVERQAARRDAARAAVPAAWKRVEKRGLKAWR